MHKSHHITLLHFTSPHPNSPHLTSRHVTSQSGYVVRRYIYVHIYYHNIYCMCIYIYIYMCSIYIPIISPIFMYPTMLVHHHPSEVTIPALLDMRLKGIATNQTSKMTLDFVSYNGNIDMFFYVCINFDFTTSGWDIVCWNSSLGLWENNDTCRGLFWSWASSKILAGILISWVEDEEMVCSFELASSFQDPFVFPCNLCQIDHPLWWFIRWLHWQGDQDLPH